ncbi:hypothetical protein MAHJHV57_50340 [Mycobacterium avium subsp. hominissuis]
MHTPAAPDATAMAVRGGVITWLGGDDVGRSLFPDADVVAAQPGDDTAADGHRGRARRGGT